MAEEEDPDNDDEVSGVRKGKARSGAGADVQQQACETLIKSVEDKLRDWMKRSRMASLEINLQMQQCLRELPNVQDQQRIDMLNRRFDELHTELKQKQQEERTIIDYVSAALDHVQAIFADLHNIHTLENGTLDIQRIPDGWQKFCLSEEDIEEYGDLLRAQWPV